MEQTDGPIEYLFQNMTTKKRKGGDIAAVFVHAGAGFHSNQNENIHLEACAKASQAGMAFLKAGGTALDAAEAAVRVLEDNEITNAGYGSNLAIDGVVECDATIVDHYGRSGAVGAMGQVAHPIHVARLILEGSTHRLSLRRVPPNLLVGQGATDFAYEHNVPIMHPDFLVSPTAKQRWKRWRKELEQAHEKGTSDVVQGAGNIIEAHHGLRPKFALKRTPSSDKRLAPLVNESQPFSPYLSPGLPGSPATQSHEEILTPNVPYSPSKLRPPPGHDYCKIGACNRGSPSVCPAMVQYSSLYMNGSKQDGFTELISTESEEGSFIDPEPPMFNDPSGHVQPSDPHSPSTVSSKEGSGSRSLHGMETDDESLGSAPDVGQMTGEDHITDTVGAIAIDTFGNIAAASSSGGIGMKHRGRTGPAALVGIGTAVHPVHAKDKTRKCVAVVTSGTGEHMATTMAAGACANRLYSGTKAAPSGGSVSADDEEAMQSFLEEDFMGHPSVKYSSTTAAIGVMAVKKTTEGVWFYFAHNTDSFALCSLTSEDAEPKVVMSRMANRNGRINTGGRSCGWRPPKDAAKEPKRRKTLAAVIAKRDDQSPRSDSPASVKTGSPTTSTD